MRVFVSKHEKRQSMQDKRIKHKALGDRSYSPASQTFGTLSSSELVEDVEIFVKLAQGYRFEGEDRTSLCAYNAAVCHVYVLQRDVLKHSAGSN